MLLVGRHFPDFQGPAVMPDGKILDNFILKNYIQESYGIVFFYPMDFTFVCPSELIALSKRMPQFELKNTKVVSVSVDSQFVHHAWRELAVNKGGIGKVNYPMIADVNHRIVRDFGVEHIVEGVALRATFVIGKDGIVKHQSVNDLPYGRNIDDIFRVIDMIDFHEKNGDVCPAGWSAGAEGMKPNSQGAADYLSKNADTL